MGVPFNSLYFLFLKKSYICKFSILLQYIKHYYCDVGKCFTSKDSFDVKICFDVNFVLTSKTVLTSKMLLASKIAVTVAAVALARVGLATEAAAAATKIEGTPSLNRSH